MSFRCKTHHFCSPDFLEQHQLANIVMKDPVTLSEDMKDAPALGSLWAQCIAHFRAQEAEQTDVAAGLRLPRRPQADTGL